MKTLKDFDFQDKKVLLRVNFDVPLNKKQEIEDDFRIRKSLPTIRHLLEKGAGVILISHLGRPSEGKKLSLNLLREHIEGLLGQQINFVKDCTGNTAQKAAQALKPGEVLLLENLRFYNGEGENEPEFAKNLAQLADIYVNDAFSVCHREHASVVGVAKHLPSAAGLLLEQETETLNSVIKEPQRPLVLVLGGAKIETKLPLLINFLDVADHILIGGKLASVILGAKKIAVSSFHLNGELEEKLEKLELTDPKLHLPVDALAGLKNHDRDYLRKTAAGKIRNDEQMFDIGPETTRIFSDILQEAKTIIWNGPMGYLEDERFASGTLAVASAILRSGGFSVAGGGDTAAFLTDNNLGDKFGYISTGGGAMLDFLSGKELPGINALKQE